MVIIIIIIVFLSVFLRQINGMGLVCDDSPRKMFSCLHKWELIQACEMKRTAFLTNTSLSENICRMRTQISIEKMDRCVTESFFPPLCDHVYIVWTSIKEKLTFLCRYIDDFIAYKNCRESDVFLNKYQQCFNTLVDNSDDKMDDCKNFKNSRACFIKVAQSCSLTAAEEFFKLLFDAWLLPRVQYSCPEDPGDVKSFDKVSDSIPNDGPVVPADNNRRTSEKQAEETKSYVVLHVRNSGISTKRVCTLCVLKFAMILILFLTKCVC